MSTLQSEDCQTNDLNGLFPMSIESLRFPLHNSMRIIFTGYYNGFNIEVRSAEEMSLLHQMGCFGKGSASRSRPSTAHEDGCTNIMRKRQILKRNYWYKKFGGNKETAEIDYFLQEVDKVTAKIVNDGNQLSSKEVIDLVSSDDNDSITADNEDDRIECNNAMQNYDTHDLVVIVPNSDSEEDNYFAKIRPKCCVNKVKVMEKLMLTPEEAFFLLYGLGCLQIISLQNNILNIQQCWDLFTSADIKFMTRYVVYHYFRSKGYIVKPGIKFGGDYCMYLLPVTKYYITYLSLRL